MDAMDIESKLSDVTVTCIPIKSNHSASTTSSVHLQQQQQQQQQHQQIQNQIQNQIQQQQLQMQLNALNAQASNYMNAPVNAPSSAASNGNGNASFSGVTLQTAPGVSKYSHLLAIIEEMGRDIHPTYSGSRTSAERLKRGIVHARILVRECLMETERAARN